MNAPFYTHHVKHSAGVYPVIIGDSTLSLLPTLIPDTLKSCRICVVTDRRVAQLYKQQISEILNASGMTQLEPFVFQPGEKSKSLPTLKRLLIHLSEHQLTRTDLILGLGGGVTGDLSGFAASVFMRGIPHIQIPTTLLAQADSSVGGKTGINLPTGKNLIGSFHAPSLVICDLKTLDTLPQRHIRNGFAEIIKMALLGDADLFEFLEKHAASILQKHARAELMHALVTANKLKSKIVEQDEKEHGIRIFLNLGHTFAHGLEHIDGYRTLLHGEAVAIGLLAATRLSVSLSICQKDIFDRLKNLLERTGLPTQIHHFDKKSILEVMNRDKKNRSGKLQIVLPQHIGQVTVVEDVEPKLLIQSLNL